MKQLLFSLLLCLILSITLEGQENSKKYHFGAHLSPSLSSGFNSNNDDLEFSSRFSYGLGFDFIYNVRSYWQFRTGIAYHQVNVEEIDYSIFFGCDFEFEVDPEVIRKNSYFINDYSLGYLSIPLINRFFLSQRSNPFFIDIGVEPSFQINNRSETSIYECGIDTDLGVDFTNQTSNLLWNIYAAFGLTFDNNQKAKFSISPYARYALNSLNSDSNNMLQISDSYHLLQYGVQFGVHF